MNECKGNDLEEFAHPYELDYSSLKSSKNESLKIQHNIKDNNNLLGINSNNNNNNNFIGINNNNFYQNNPNTIKIQNNDNFMQNNNINNNINYINKINIEQIDKVEDDKICIDDHQLLDNNIINNNSIKEENNLDLISNSNKINIKEQKIQNHKYSIYSNSSSNVGVSTTNDSEYCSSNNLIAIDRNSILEKNTQLLVDIKRIIFLEDRRTSIMIKNIPNKFSAEFLLNTINQNFKGSYNIFILPTDSNKYKNYGYAFINFNSCYYIPYFYYLFNGKMWLKTNSTKICEITYSKIQGKKNLINHYQNKIVYQNDAAKNNTDIKFVIPNDYKMLFKQAFPKQNIEEYQFYFITKIPNKK